MLLLVVIFFVMLLTCFNRIRELKKENIKLTEELVISENESCQLWKAFDKVNQITTVDIIGIQTLAEAREGR